MRKGAYRLLSGLEVFSAVARLEAFPDAITMLVGTIKT